MPSRIDPSDMFIERLTSDHDITSFRCSKPALTEYLTQNAHRDGGAHVTVTYLAFYGGECVGYFSLLNDNIIKKDLYPEDNKDGYSHSFYPAIKIAWFATREEYEGRDVGKTMMARIIAIAVKLSRYSGCRVLTVDSKPDVESFYERCGFRKALKTRKKNTIPMYYNLF